MTAPKVLVVTSDSASAAAVTPVLAALEAVGMTVRAIDAGRPGHSETTFDRMIRVVTGAEPQGARVTKELTNNPPDVAVAFDPGATTVLTVARDQALDPAPVVAVVDELTPDEAWAVTDADRYLVVDDEAAYSLQQGGVPGDRILCVGPLCESRFWQASTQSRNSLRQRFKLGSGPVVVVQVDGLGYDTTTQVALQLSLSEQEPTYLFDAGDDSDAATALRRQVPGLGIRAKLFGRTNDEPLLWRCADVIIARPRPATVARALVLGTPMVSFVPEDRAGERLAKGLEARGMGTSATNPLLLSGAMEPLIKRSTGSDDRVGTDGAANVADIAWIVGSEGDAVIDRRNRAAAEATAARVTAAANAAEARARVSAAAGGLEDLSGGVSAPAASAVPDQTETDRLRVEVEMRIEQVNRVVVAAREAAEAWERKRAHAQKKGNTELAQTAERNADRERARMHASLAEMSQLQSEMHRLEQAAAAAADAPPPRPTQKPPRRSARRRGSGTSAHAPKSVDDMLEEMKRNVGSGGGAPSSSSASSSAKSSSAKSSSSSSRRSRRRRKPKGPSVDDELAALKRKMRDKDNR